MCKYKMNITVTTFILTESMVGGLYLRERENGGINPGRIVYIQI